MAIEVLTLSSKGQLVLPKEMRDALSVGASDKLMAYCADGAIVLKPLKLPKEEAFVKAMGKTMAFASESGLKEDDVGKAIKEARGKAASK
jgi:antitoxin PrlF